MIIRNQLRKVFLWLGFIIGFSIFIYQIFISFNSYINKSFSLSSGWILLAILSSMISLGLQILSWRVIMSGIGFGIQIWPAFKGYIPSFLPRYIPGTIWGYLSRSEWLNKKFGIPYRYTNYGSILELSISIFANILITTSLILYFNKYNSILIVLIGVLLVGFSFFLVNIYIYRKSLGNELKNYWKLSINPRLLIESFLLFLGTWFLYGLSLFFVLNGLEVNTGYNDLVLLTFVYNLSWLLGFMIFIAPSGMGFRELSISILLQNNLGLSTELSISVSVMMRLAVLISEFFWLAIIFLPKIKIKSTKK